MELISFMIVVWTVKVLAEDAWTTVQGQTNPRIERRRARQRSRANNPIWTQFVGWLGDLAEDARQEQTRKRQERHKRRQVEPEPFAVREPVRSTWPDDPVTPEPEKTDSPPDPEPQPEPRPAAETDEGTDAQIIPLFPTKEDPNMTATTTGEATGLVSAMNHAGAMKTSYEDYAASGDTFVASLATGEVSGDAVAAAQQAREHEEQAAAAWGRCHAALAEQIKVKEAYQATPGAGSREFVTAE